jgi:drug/metabolite transporter (DMT)-like permease
VGVIVGCVPIVLALAGPLLAHRAPVARVVAAALVVTVGAAVVQGVGDSTLAGFLLSLGALVGEALFSLLAVSLLPRLGPVVLSTYVCAMAAGGLGVAAVLVDGDQALPLPSAEEGAAIAYLAVVVTAIAFVAWYSGVQRLGVERAGLFAGLIPVRHAVLCGGDRHWLARPRRGARSAGRRRRRVPRGFGAAAAGGGAGRRSLSASGQ